MKKIFYTVAIASLLGVSCNEVVKEEVSQEVVPQEDVSEEKIQQVSQKSNVPELQVLEVVPPVVEIKKVSLTAGKSERFKEAFFTHEVLKDYLSIKSQQFYLPIDKDTLITCVEGTKLYFPAKIFDIEEEVKIEVQENYSLKSFIANDLVTTSGDQLLETGGMLKITATAGGKEVLLKEGKEYAVYFPKDVHKEGMQLFYGEHSEETGIVDWEMEEMPEIDEVSDDLEEISSGQLCSCNISIVEYTSGIGKVKGGSSEVTWKMKDSDETIFTYFDKNFDVSTQMKTDFCNDDLVFRVSVVLDSKGKVRRAYVNRSATPQYDSLLTRFLYDMPALDMSVMAPDLYDSNTRYTLAFKRKLNAKGNYNSRFQEKYASFKDKAIEKVDKAELNYYMFTATKLGWINCDRFWNTKEEKVPYFVKTEPGNSVKVILTFKQIKSAMQGRYTSGNTKFENLPLGQPVKIIGIKYDKEKPSLAVAETVVSTQPFKLEGFEEFTLTDLETQLNSLD